MATWTVGSPAGEAGGEREEGGAAETKRRPPGTRRPAREPPAAGGGAGGRRRPAEGSGLTFSCRSRPRRPPWWIGARDAFTARGPQARSGLSAGSLHTRGGEKRHVQRWGVRGGKPLVRSEEGEQTAVAEVQLWLGRASPGAACQGPGRRTGQSGSEGDPRVPSDEAVLCTEELRQRQGAGKGGGARGGARAEGSVEGPRARGARRALTQARLTWGGGGFLESQWRGTQAASPHPSPRLSQPIRRRSAEAQLGRAAALTCSSVCRCGGKRKEMGCGQTGSGDSAPSPRESSGWLWEALLRRDFGVWVSSLHHTSCCRCSKSPAPFSAAVLCRVAARSAKSQFKKADFFASWQQILVLLLRCVTVGSFLPGYPTRPCHRPHPLPCNTRVLSLSLY